MTGLIERFSSDPIEPPEEAAPLPTADEVAQPIGSEGGLVNRFLQVDSSPQGPQSLGQEFEAGVSTGTDQLQTSLFGLGRLVGRELGIPELENASNEGIVRNQEEAQEFAPSVAGFSEVEDFDSFFKWAAGGLGNAVPSLATAIGGGGVGGILAKKGLESQIKRTLVSRVTRNMVSKGFTHEQARDAAERTLLSQAGFKMLRNGMTQGVDNAVLLNQGFTRGAQLGAFASSAAPQIGQADIALQERGIDSGLTAILAGTAGGALEALPALRILDRVFPGVDRAVSRGFVQDFAKGVGIQSVLEGSTEAAQEVIQLAALAFHDPSFDMLDPMNITQITDAFAAGALVGGVTGGLAEVPSIVSQLPDKGKNRIKTILPAFEFTPNQEVETEADDFEPADQTFFKDVGSRINRIVEENITPAMNKVRDTFQDGIDAAAAAAPQLNESIGEFKTQIVNGHNAFVKDHQEILSDISRYAKEQTAFITERAETLKGDERAQFIAQSFAELKEDVKKVADSIREKGKGRATELESEIEGAGVFDDDFQINEPGSQFVFGKSNTEGDSVQGFKDRNGARGLISKLRNRFPSATDSTFEVREGEDGKFTVALADSGQAEALIEDDIVSRSVEDARQSARRNPNKDRQASIQRPGVKGKTIIDVPTLVFAGRKLDAGDNQTVEQAFAAVTGRLLERGIIDNNSFEALQNTFRFQFPSEKRTQTLAQARREQPERRSRKLDFESLPVPLRTSINELVDNQINEEFPTVNAENRGEVAARRAELIEQRLDQLDDQLTASNTDVDNIPGQQGDEAAFVEAGDGRNLETDAQQARRQSSNSTAKPRKRTARKPSKRPAPINNKLNGTNKSQVFMPGVPKEVAQAVTEITRKLGGLLSDKTKVRVVNAAGAQAMIDKGHAHASIVQSLLDFPGDFAVKYSDDGPTYVLVGDVTAPEGIVQLTHEYGHILHHDTWNSLSKANQDKLFDAFVTDAKSGTRTTGATLTRTGKEQSTAAVNQFEFKEWMADQFVDWMNNRRQPRTAIEKFLDTVGKKIDQLWDFIKQNPGRYNQLNQTFAQFADAVALGLKNKDPSGVNPFFDNEGAAGQPLHLVVEGAGSVLPQGVTKSQWNQVTKRIETQYPAIVARAATMTKWMHNAYHLLLAPSTSVMRSLSGRAPSAKKLISIFNRENILEAKKSSNYHQRIKLIKGSFLNRRDAITKGMTEAEKSTLVARLRVLDNDKNASPLSLRETQMRKLFDDMHAYMTEAGLPVGNIVNYFPRTFSREKLIANQDKIIAKLEKDGMTNDEAKGFFNSLISKEADDAGGIEPLVDVALDELGIKEMDAKKKDRREKETSPSFRNMKSRTAKGKFFDQFLDDNLDGIMANYIVSATKRAEFNRFMGEKAPTGAIGGDALPNRVWNSRGTMDKILADAKKEGATKEDLQKMRNYIDVNLGTFGRDDVSDRARTAMAAVIAYQNMRVLMFTVFASLPDLVGPAIRSGSMKGAFSSVRQNMKKVVTNDNDLAEMARAWGQVSSAANQHVMTEYVDNHFMPPTLKKWNEGFFKWTGLNYYTDVTRKMALAVGVDSLKDQASKAKDATSTQKSRDRAKQFLAEFGLTAADVNTWQAQGEQVWGGVGYDNQNNTNVDEKIAEALVQFVDESIMSPNASQRPIAASHPGMMLVFHLKGYIYAMHDIIIKRLASNLHTSETPAQVAAAIAPALLMISLTAIGMELRELITGSDRTDRMNGWDYTWNVVERSGLTGIAQLGFDFNGAGARGQSELVALGGPAIGQVADLISKPVSQTIPTSIPIVSQLPWMRDALREATPL